MQKFVALFLIVTMLLVACTACAEQEPTHIYFTISAPAVSGDEPLPAIHRTITFPISALEKKTVMFAILYACDALGYSHEREGKYNENLVSVAGRVNLTDSFWVIEASDKNGNSIPVTTDSALDGIVNLSIAYQ